MIGWTGNQTSKSADDVLEDVLTDPHPEDMLVEFRVNFKENDGSNKTNRIRSWQWSELGKVEFERVIYPFGRCLKLKIPIYLKRYQIMSMQISPNITSMKSKNVDRVKIYFKDPNFDSKFLSSSFNPSKKEIENKMEAEFSGNILSHNQVNSIQMYWPFFKGI